jgi:hypothetical protein
MFRSWKHVPQIVVMRALMVSPSPAPLVYVNQTNVLNANKYYGHIQYVVLTAFAALLVKCLKRDIYSPG